MGSQRRIALPLLSGVLLLIPFLGGAGGGAPTSVEAEVRGLLAELSAGLSCGGHACDGDGEEDLDFLASLLPTLDLRTLEALQFEGLGVRLNAERGAIQVLGCQDRVVMSVPFSGGVRANLMSNGI